MVVCILRLASVIHLSRIQLQSILPNSMYLFCTCRFYIIEKDSNSFVRVRSILDNKKYMQQTKIQISLKEALGFYICQSNF
jgi:hypothetical protein